MAAHPRAERGVASLTRGRDVQREDAVVVEQLPFVASGVHRQLKPLGDIKRVRVSI